MKKIPPLPGENGFTLVEALIALSLLGLSFVLVWYEVKGSQYLNSRVETRNAALRLAENEMERLRLRPPGEIPDTSYAAHSPTGKQLLLKRELTGSAEGETSFSLRGLDSESKKDEPRTARVLVWEAVKKSTFSLSDTAAPLIELELLLPNYQW